MASTPSNTNTATPSGPSQQHELYVFEGIVGDDRQWKPGLSPVQNSVFYIREPDLKSNKVGSPVVGLKTDGKGLLHHITKGAAINALKKDDEKDASVKKGSEYYTRTGSTTAVDVKHVIRPPAEVLSLTAAAKGEDWNKTIKKFLEEQVAFDAEKSAIQVREVDFHLLRKPKIVKAEDKNSEQDNEYADWYQKQVKLGKRSIRALLIPKVRIVFFVFTIPAKVIAGVKFNIPGVHGEVKAQEASTAIDGINNLSEKGYSVFYARGTDEQLPTGLWEIKVELKPLELMESIESGAVWSESIVNNNSYTLREGVRFNIVNPIGEFEMILADPLSVEEALMAQFASSLGHLVDYASAYDDDQAKEEVTNKNFNLKWQAINDFASMPGNAALADFSSKPKAAETLIAATQHLIPDDDTGTLRRTLNAIFDTRKFIYDFNDFLDKIKKENTSGLTGLAKYFEIPDYAKESDLNDLKKGAASKLLKLSDDQLVKIAQVNKYASSVLGVAEIGVNTYMLGMNYKEYRSSVETYKNSKANYLGYFEQFLAHMEDNNKGVDITLDVKFALDSDVFESDFKEPIQTAANMMNTVVEQYEEYKNNHRYVGNKPHFVVHGHTCDLGTLEHNDDLSKRRAKRVHDALIECGAPKDYLGDPQGHGESIPIYYNSLGDAARALNRRVALKFNALDHVAPAPCREVIGVFEKHRTNSVLLSIGADEDFMKTAQAAIDLAIGFVAVFAAPAGTLVAAALALAGLAKKAFTSIFRFADKLFCDSRYTILSNDKDRRWAHLKTVKANMEMLTDMSEENLNKAKLDNSEKEDAGKQNAIYLATRFRVRASVLNGFMYLIQRAVNDAVPSVNDGFQQRFEKQVEQYRIQAYVQNFMLNDQWSFPLRNTFIPLFNRGALEDVALKAPLSAVSPIIAEGVVSAINGQRVSGPAIDLGRYWAFITNSGLTDRDDLLKAPIRHRFSIIQRAVLFSLDENYHLLTEDELTPEAQGDNLNRFLGKDGESLNLQQKLELTTIKTNPYNRIYANCSDLADDHIRAGFQHIFPMSYMSTESYLDLAKNMKTTWEEIKKEHVLYVEVFRHVATDSGMAWSSLADEYKRKRIGQGNGQEKQESFAHVDHDTEITILVVFDDKHVTSPFPVSVQVNREAWFGGDGQGFGDINGPTYTETVTPLSEVELSPYIKDAGLMEELKGKFGCTIQPAYACGKKMIKGLKPMSSDFYVSSYFPEMFYKINAFSEMVYTLKLTPAQNGDEKFDLPLRLNKATRKPFNQKNTEINVSIRSQYPAQDPLLSESFLTSCSEKFAVPELFNGKINRVAAMVRFSRKDNPDVTTPYINGNSGDDDMKAANSAMPALDMEDDFYFNSSFDEDNTLKIKSFDWETPVEFLVLVAASSVNRDEYMKYLSKDEKANFSEKYGSIDWRKVPASIGLYNEKGWGETKGPRYSSHLKYLGKINSGGTLANYEFSDGESLVGAKGAPDDSLDDAKKQLFGGWENLSSRQRRLRLQRCFGYDVEDRFGFKFNVMNPLAPVGEISEDLEIYAMTITPHYQSPKRKNIDGLRPFGKPDTNFELFLDKLHTSSKNDFSEKDETGELENTRFLFSEPNQPLKNQPWTKALKGLSESDAEKIVQRNKDGKEDISDILKDGEISESRYERWLKDESEVIKFSDHDLFSNLEDGK